MRDIFGKGKTGMKRKLLCAFAISIICAITAVGAAAADISGNIEAPVSERSTGNITVSGNVGESRSEYVFVVITDASKGASDMTEAEITANAYTVGQCTSGADGSFSITLRLAEKYDDGQYKCIVYTAGGNSGETSFTYRSPYVIPRALEALNGYKLDSEVSGDETKFLGKFESVKALFATNTSAFYDTSFTQTEKEALVKIMIQIRPKNGWKTVSEFNEDFAAAEYLTALNGKTNPDDVYAFLETEAAKKALRADSRYQKAAESVRKTVSAEIAPLSFALPKDFCDTFIKKLAVAEFGSVTVWNDLTELVQKYSDLVTVDSESQTKLAGITVEDACQKMYSYRNEMTTVDGIISAYQKGIADAYAEKYPNGVQQPAGGGGGGSSATEESPVVLPIVDNSKPQQEKERFSDLSGYDWAKAAIYELTESGIIAGYPDGRFGSGDFLTREQAVVMLVKRYKITELGDAAIFSDVEEGAWYYDCLRCGIGAGIISGMGDGKFGIGLPITRQDFAVMVYSATGAEYAPAGTAKLNDLDSVSQYARRAVEALTELGIISGDGNGNFRPQDYVTRAEAAVILSKLG